MNEYYRVAPLKLSKSTMNTQSNLNITPFEPIWYRDVVYPTPDHAAEIFGPAATDPVQGFMAGWSQVYGSITTDSMTQDSPVPNSPNTYEQGLTSAFTRYHYPHHVANEGQQSLPKIRTTQTTSEATGTAFGSPTVAQAPVSSKFSSRRRGR